MQAWLAASLATVPFLTALYCFVFLTSPTPLTSESLPWHPSAVAEGQMERCIRS